MSETTAAPVTETVITATPPATETTAPPETTSSVTTTPTEPTTPTTTPVTLADFTIPEGITADTALVGEFKNVAQELGLSQEHAQKIVDKLATFMNSHGQAQFAALKEQFLTEAKADGVIGGAKFDAAIQDAQRFINTYPHAATLREFLETTGAGNHKEIIKLVSWCATKIGEPTGVVRAGAASSSGITQEQFNAMRPAERAKYLNQGGKLQA